LTNYNLTTKLTYQTQDIVVFKEFQDEKIDRFW